MNGDIYLRRQPESRERRAVVISVDKIEKEKQLYNVERDADVWSAFLQTKCGFAVTKLTNPDLRTFQSGLRDVTFSEQEKQGSLRNPLLHKVTAAKGLQAVKPAEGPRNTLFVFVYSGAGAYKTGSNYLMTYDAKADPPERMWEEMMPLADIQDLMRKKAAASILILDTNFFDLDKVGKGSK
jgi:hypothetical protein